MFTGPPLRNFLKAGERGEPGNLGTEVPPVGSRGKAPIRGADDRGNPEAEAKWEIGVHFPVENLGLNYYRSSILVHKHNKKIPNFHRNEGVTPHPRYLLPGARH